VERPAPRRLGHEGPAGSLDDRRPNFTSKGGVPWDFTVDDIKFIK
jgi:hypothetical protein